MKVFRQNIVSPLSDSAYLDCYIQSNESCSKDRVRPAIVICPGGGYEMVADREGEPIAIKMLSLGFQAFVLNYSLTPTRFPVSLTELASSVKFVRDNAEKFHIDPASIFVAGFSAGGHLAASLGVYWNNSLLKEYDYNPQDIQPNALLLGYSVITSGKYRHEGSIVNLIGKENMNNQEILDKVSLEKHVDTDTPDSFIWCTDTDDVVPMQNSLLFASALKKADKRVELIVYPKGGHGLSLGNLETAHPSQNDLVSCVQDWPDKFAEFALLIGHNFLNED